MLDPLDNKNRPYLRTLEKKRAKAFRILSIESLLLHSWRLFFWILLFSGIWMLSLPSFFGQISSIITSIVFSAGFIYLFKNDILSFKFPRRKGLDHSIEKISKLPRGQISLTEDELANPKKHDTRNLWNTAQKQSMLSFKNLKSPKLKSFLSREDPSALRYIAVLLFISGFMVSGSLWKEKIYAGLIPFSSSYATSQGKSTNIWIKPPDYTQIPQIHLSGHGTYDETLDIPEDSEIRIRIHNVFGEYFAPHLHNGTKTVKMTHMGDGLYGIETVIEEGKYLSITQGFITRAKWNYNFIKDTPPEIRSDVDTAKKNTEVVRIDDVLPPLPFEEPKDEKKENTENENENDQEIAEIKDEQRYEVLDNYQIRFPLIVEDDYGVKELRMTMNIDEMVEDIPLGETAQETRLVMSQPDVEFKISPIYNLTWHTWAGLPVTFTYEAIDHKGQISKLKEIKLILPERKFDHPMAKSLIAMRKRLAWDYKGSFVEIAENLETLLSAPDFFQNNPVIYLAIRVASSRLYYNDGMSEKLRLAAAKEVINLLWYTALSIEEGDISLAMRELHDAQRALENTMLDPNASDEEIRQLMDNLRDKMVNYFAEMQRDMQKRMENGENFPTFSADDFGEIISPDTLSKMMEDIEQALRDGDEQKAQELMSQLQRMMEMMDPSRGAQLPKDMQVMREGVNELQQLIDRQESLIEQTQKQAAKQKSVRREQRRKQSTMTPRSLPTLEQMLKDFGMDNIPPQPSTPDKKEKQEQKNTNSSKGYNKGTKTADDQKQERGQKHTKDSNSNKTDQKKQEPAENDNKSGDNSDNDSVRTSKNKTEQDALRYILGQLMMDAAEHLDEVPEKMGMAEQEMRGSADALGKNDPKGSLPHQDKAVKYLKDAQESLAQQFKKRMQQMVGIGMSGGSQKYDPLGRRYSNEDDPNGRSVDSKVEVPDKLDKKRVDEIIKMLRDRSGDRSRSREELNYFRRLLRQF